MDVEQYARRYFHFYIDEPSQLISKYLKRVKSDSLLDLGCGDGALLYSLNKRGFLKNKNVFAVDLSKERIKNTKLINKKFKCFVSDACDISIISDSSIDFLISRAVIEHVRSDNQMMSEIGRVVKKGGYVYLMTVLKKWYGWHFYRCNGKWTMDPTHVREYRSETELQKLIHRYDFEVLENKKTWTKRSIINNRLLRLIGGNREIGDNSFVKVLRKIKIPLIGYLDWELVLKKR